MDFMNLARVARAIRGVTPQTDGDDLELRLDAYGSQFALPLLTARQAMADEGSYFVALNPTIGTFPQYALQTAFSDTAALFAINNTNPQRGGQPINCLLDHLTLRVGGTAPTATVSMEFAVKLDPGNRSPTANSAAITPVSPNGNLAGQGSGVNVFAFNAGAMTVPASTGAAITAARARIPTSLGLVGDEYRVRFGGGDDTGSIPGLTAARAVAVARLEADAAPVIIPPGWWAVIYMWWLTAATTAPSFEYELGFAVR